MVSKHLAQVSVVNGLCSLTLAAAVATLAGAVTLTHSLPQDAGAAGAWQTLLKLQTTASVMQTTAHPDDEQGGVLALLSRGQGVRTALATLTRGESGDNAIGPELFDALGLIRTEELRRADAYYGVDAQYYTTAVDYGFSKRLDEALEKWGRENVLRDLVAIIRTDRPLIVISRFQGNERDGHGNHQAAGVLTQQACATAGDARVFPDQIASGLRPWQPLKLYMAGVRENEDWTIQIDSGAYDPVLGESYQSFARRGLSFQRSQNGGVFQPSTGPSVSYFKRLQSVVDAPAREASFFDGIDTTIPGIYTTLRTAPPAGADALLQPIAREIASAAQAFRMTDPAAAVPALARALAATHTAEQQLGRDQDVAFILRAKERQLEEAITAALGVAFTAVTDPQTLPPVVPGQTFKITMTFVNRSAAAVSNVTFGWTSAAWHTDGGIAASGSAARPNQPLAVSAVVKVPEAAPLTRPYFTRTSIQDARYAVTDPSQAYRPSAEPALIAEASYDVDGVRVRVRKPVTRLEANLPYGYDTRELAVVPAIGVSLSPAQTIVPLGASKKTVAVRAEIVSNVGGSAEGTLTLRVPAGWQADPAIQRFHFTHAGERVFYPFTITTPALADRDYRIEAVAASGGRAFSEGYDVVEHRDLETRYLYRAAATSVRGVDVTVPSALNVGYVMGIGDLVPAGLAQLGVRVRLLGAQDLASADLGQFDTIITGTRAYAVRDELKTYSRRLLEYVRNGGNLIVLYNTQEFDPRQYAPFPGELPRDAEEVSEEDSPVEILAPSDPVFTTPNRLTTADFDHWVEQRGSKFWSSWDPAYTAMIATWDKGQPPQKGGWLHARYGKGHYTYFAYAVHRQLPYGVPGAYRLLANLLSLNK